MTMTLGELIELLRNAPSAEVLDERREDIINRIPRLREFVGYNQNSRYHQYDLWIHTLHVAAGLPRGLDDGMLYLGALLHDIGKPACRCRGKDPKDPYMHYYGHPQEGRRIVEEEILPKLEQEGEVLPEEDRERLLFYVEHHDDQMSRKRSVLRKHWKEWGEENFRKLMLLEIADANAHITSESIIAERLELCGDILRWLDSGEYGDIEPGGLE